MSKNQDKQRNSNTNSTGDVPKASADTTAKDKDKNAPRKKS